MALVLGVYCYPMPPHATFDDLTIFDQRPNLPVEHNISRVNRISVDSDDRGSFNRPLQGYKPDAQSAVARAERYDDATPIDVFIPLPPELWQQIVLHLDLWDVLKLVLVSLKLYREGTNLHHGLVGLGHHLAAVSKEMPKNPHCILISASFSAARASGITATVFVGQDATQKKLTWGYITVSGTAQPDAADEYRTGKWL
ncbi:uncharacterized protein F5891DRAFT_1199023 [Suillus fuscotomentosus]|uniref:F-box domain-containing protein n=1 Tax=Suillus fuscotomentosus TaxID=1912939 RepID=A0AAD4DRX7_9AGAM|nr:uncharacterized protein F5891DRAFT_1199023 [Suillus fuscotomentosus]KAG1888965.1 hypothetical protein F5891DRAFT_1199023 [Suillus fuscotomentosus]